MDALPGMGLPAGWVSATLGELCDVIGGITVDAKRGGPGHVEVPYLRVANVQRGRLDLSKMRTILVPETKLEALTLQHGDVLLNEGGDRDKVGRGWVWEDQLPQCVFQNHVFRARVRDDVVCPYFLSFYLNEFGRDYFLTGAKQTTNLASISLSAVKGAPVVVPPRAEQDRIVTAVNNLFDEVEAGEAALARAREGLTQFRASLLHAACTGALTADWRPANPADISPEQLLAAIAAERARKVAKRYRDAETPEGPPPFDLPRSWGWATMDQLCWQIDYGSSARCRPMPDGVPVLRMGNIQAGRLDYKDLKHLPEDHDEFPGLLLEQGDLLFNRTNSAELVGKTAVFDGHDRPVSFASYIVRAKAVQVRPQFLAHYINSPLGRQWITSVMTQQVGQANVSGGRLRTLCVPVPPLPEQDEIVTRVADSLDVARDAALGDPCVEEAAKLRQSILHAAFNGRLVAQDPADEPAAALLARLRAAPTAARRPRARRTTTQPDLIETPA